MKEVIDTDEFKQEFLDEIFGEGPETYSLIPPKDKMIKRGGLLIFDEKRTRLESFPNAKQKILEGVRIDVMDWIYSVKEERPHLVKRLEKLIDPLN